MKNTPASLDFNDQELSHGEEKKITLLSAMEHHVSKQKERLLEQAELLKKQLELINKREELAKLIYAAKYSFEPVLLKRYTLYQNNDGSTLSMIEPHEWSGISPYGEFVAFVRQLGDSTWEEIHNVDIQDN